MKQLLKTGAHSLLRFFYPSFCLHCNEQTFGRDKWICKECFSQIEWIDSSLACQTCGRPKRRSDSVRCSACHNKWRDLAPFSACFLPEGPAKSLYEYMFTYESEDVAKIFASLMAVKWQKLGWPFPDVIVPIPDSRLEKFALKNQPSYLMAKALSKMLSISFKPVLTTCERGAMFTFRSKFFQRGLTGEKVLLIAATVKESQTLCFAQSALSPLFPESMYTLALFDYRH